MPATPPIARAVSSFAVAIPFVCAFGVAAGHAGAQGREPVQRPIPGAKDIEAAPITVTTRQTGPTEITVTWTAVPGAQSYFIGRHAPPDGWRRVNTPTPAATRYVDRDVQVGRTYRYQVSAIVSGVAGRRFTSDSVVVEEGIVAVAGGGGEGEAEAAAPAESRAEMIERVYGLRARSVGWWTRGAGRARPFWIATADVSGFDEAELTRRWTEIAIAAQLYQHIFLRPPTKDELMRQLQAQVQGVPYDTQWRTLAQSAKREREHGIFAPAPMTLQQAQGLFGWRNPRPGEQCFGGLGPGCTGTIPPVFEWVQPRWEAYFNLPDGTEMAYVNIGVAVGSIMHDNACLDDRTGSGVACSGWVAIQDITKHSGVPAAMEWNKAAWNVIDGRGWRHTFGPYPVDLTLRRKWYDDLRPVPARRAHMAKVLGTLTLPIHDQPYRGQERKGSAVLSAPPGTTIDGGDVSYCKSKRFKRTESPLGKAPSGICW
ncbi:MAG TPA: fibronectin type III domain-containing protein [Gemmatimonadaceae bacterium]|nr:fibronectin type III domain-containing protein [Gemmatimonadaceae bacterium]